MSNRFATNWGLRAGLAGAGAVLVVAACSAGGDSERASSTAEALTIGVPYRVRAIDFTAFNDSDTVHEGTCGTGPVDQQTVSDNGITCGVAYTKPGEWLEYSLQVAAAGKFSLVSRVAGNATGKTIRLLIDGVAVGGSQSVPSGGWTTFADRTVNDIAMSAGTHTLRVLFETGDTNFNYVDVTPGTATLPQRIEAENYQRALESTPGSNSGTGCNRGDGVDMGSTSDNAGGCLVGWATAGEWLEYDVTVPQSGLFDLTARLASANTGRTLQFSVDGATIGSVVAPSTGYNAFEDRKLQNISLSAGPHVLRATFVQGDLNLNYLDISVHPVVPGFSLGATVNYNAFVFQDLSIAPSVPGPVAAGRDIVSQGFSFNTSAAGSIGALAGRNFNGTSGNVQRDLVYGTALSLNNVNVLQGTSRKASPLDFVAEKATLDQLSTNLASFTANGSTAISPSGTVFTFTGTDPSRNVFTINAATLAAADQFNFTVPAMSTAILNVTGAAAVFETASMALGALTPNHLLWNFPQATTVRVTSAGFKGTLLATNAAVTLSSASIEGVLVAGAATGSNGGFTWQPFDGSLTVCSAPTLAIVPASPQLAGTPLALSATATCADNRAAEFHYDYLNSVTDTTWHEVAPGYGTSTTSWNTSSLPSGSYQVRVLARRVGEVSLSGASATSTFVFDNPILIPTAAPVVESFNSLGSASPSAVPSGWRLDKQLNPRTVGGFTAATYKTDSLGGALLPVGSNNGIYNFGAGVANAQAANYWLTSTDRAPGWLSSGSDLSSGGTKSGNLYVALRAPADKDLTSLTVGYDIEKYSNGTNPAGFRIQLYSSTDGANWTSGGGDFFGPFAPNTSNQGFDPAPGQTFNVPPTKLAARIPRNTLFYLAWNYAVNSATSNDGSNAEALAIDNISIQGSEVCVPNCTGKSCGGDGCTGLCGQLCGGAGCVLNSDCQAGLVCTGVAPGGTTPSVCQPAGYPSTCTNGVRDGNETDVDCGGSCSVCKCPAPPWGTDPCLSYSCDPATGQISSVPKSDGVACPDGNQCNGDELCQTGICRPGAPKVVDDQNACTTDDCDTSSGQVSHTPKEENTPCSDGNVCNGLELCHSGLCQAGSALVVDDGDPCTADSCDSVSGVTHEPLSDGSMCGPNKTCHAGSCADTGGGPSVPPLNPNVSTTIQSSLAFLINSQAGLQPNTVVSNRVALIRGRVTDRAGSPLAGVTVSIVGRPELGQTTSGTDGMYNLVVNGGGFLRVSFTQPARLRAERTAQVNWNEYKLLEDVALIALDGAANPVDLDETGGHLAEGSIVSDTDGTRQASVYFPANTHALVVDTNGGTTPLTQLTVRATEYTVGQNGGRAMPGALPSTSAYTYAVELSVDEAMAQNAQSVLFDQPVPVYVDNFLNMPVGAIVPVGYFDRKLGAWVASDNGLTIKILDVASGVAAIDTNGDGLAESDASLAAFGITLEERTSLAQTRGAGVSIWRFATRHFTPWDCNWPVRPWTCDEGGPCDGDAPGAPKVADDPSDCHSTVSGSIIECQSQVLRESLPVPGTPFTLNYRSGAMPGYQATAGLDIQVVGARVPQKITGVDVWVVVGGQGKGVHFAKGALQPSLGYHYSWDRRDAFGREMQGRQSAKVLISYSYSPPYAAPVAQSGSFGSFPSDTILTASREAVPLQINWFYDVPVGQLREPPSSLGGWLLGGHMHYDVVGRRLLTGEGEEVSVDPLTANSAPRTFEKYSSYSGCDSTTGWLAVAANGDAYIKEGNYIQKLSPNGALTKITGGWSNNHQYDNDGKPAIASLFSNNLSVAVGPDGSLFVSDRDDNRLQRIGPDGILHTVAGKLGTYAGTGSDGVKYYTPVAGYTGDGGPATEATLNAPAGVAVAADGTVYLSDAGNNVIRRIDTAGRITTVVGTGAPSNGSNVAHPRPADGSPSLATDIYDPNHLALAPDGSLYFDSKYSSYVLSRLGIDGKVRYVTGDQAVPDWWAAPEIGEGVPALTQPSHTYKGFTVDSQGRVYFADSFRFKGDEGAQYTYVGTRIREVSNSGLINTIAGENYTSNGTEYHRPAIRSYAARLNNLSVTPDQSLMFIGDCSIDRLRTFPVLAIPGCNYVVPSADASQLYCFDASGRHLKTLEPKTLAPLYTFGYTNELLSSVTDGSNNVTSITRDGTTGTIEIKAPFGQKTTIKTDAVSGYATKITFPDSTTVTPEHQPNGLLTGLVDARNNRHTFQYDELGRLKRDENPAGGYQTLAHSGDTVTRTTALGRENRYTTTSNSKGSTINVSRAPDGGETTTERRVDLTNHTVYRDGTTVDTSLEPDPLFGEAALYEQSRTVTTPSGLKNTSTVKFEATPSTGGGMLSSKIVRNHGTGNETATFDGSNPASLAHVLKSAAGRQTTISTDGLGRTTKVAIAGLVDSIFDYDSAGRPWHATRGARTVELSYEGTADAADKGYLSVIDPPNHKPAHIERDALGRPRSITYSGLPKTKFWYDDAGNLSFLELPQSVVSSASALHSLTSNKVNGFSTYSPPVVPSLPLPGDAQTSVFFDLDQALSSMARPGGISLTFEHDNVSGKATRTRGPSGDVLVDYYPMTPCLVGCSPGAVHTVTSPDGQKLTYAYDGALVKSVIFDGPVTASVSYDYDTSFRQSAQGVVVGSRSSKITFQYDADDLLTCASTGACDTQDTGALRVIRGGTNPLLNATSLQKVSDSYIFSEFGEIRSYTAAFNESASVTVPLVSISYDDPNTVSRDALGRILKQRDTIEGVQHTAVFSYYDTGWLHTVDRDGVRTAEYTYDNNGNRLTQRAGDAPAVYDAQDRLVSADGSTFEYTANGELQTRTTGSSETRYTYDEYGSLQRVILPDSSEVRYASDAFGRRVQRQRGSQYNRWIYSRNQIVGEIDSGGVLVSRFIYGSRPNVPDAVIKYSGNTTKTYRILSDQAGSPLLVINVMDQADRPFRASYDEFGAVTGTGLDFIPFGFAGGLYDSDTRLLRFGARDYDPTIGRWLSKDPLLFASGQANLYTYAGNDPINRRDSTGLYTEVIFWEPVGHAASSFGHVSIVINGTSYSWGPGGMDIESQASYITRNQKFRSGRGLVLGLDIQQEFALENYLKAYPGRYKALSNNCTDPIEHGLSEVGARDPNLDSLLPTGLARSLANLAIGQTAYVGPPTSAPAPWSQGIRDSFQSMY